MIVWKSTYNKKVQELAEAKKEVGIIKDKHSVALSEISTLNSKIKDLDSKILKLESELSTALDRLKKADSVIDAEHTKYNTLEREYRAKCEELQKANTPSCDCDTCDCTAQIEEVKDETPKVTPKPKPRLKRKR